MLKAVVLSAVLMAGWPVRAAERPAIQSPASDEVVVHMPPHARPVPYDIANGLLLIHARLAGRDAVVLIDNGAGRSLIDSRFAAAAGLTPLPADGVLTTPNGAVPKRSVSGVSFEIPQQLEMTTPLFVVDLADFSGTVGTRIDAVLGGDYLSNFALLVDRSRRLLMLQQSGQDFSDKGMTAVALDGSLVRVRSGSQDLTMTIDLGANDELSLRPEAWSRIGSRTDLPGERRAVSASGAASMDRIGRLAAASIGPYAVQDVQVGIRPWPATKRDGLLGMPLLGRFTFVLDIGASKLWLSPH